MFEILGQDDIDKILLSIKKMQNTPPVIFIKPSEITQIIDEKEREEMIKNFENVSYLYVYPLEKILKYNTERLGRVFYRSDYGDYPIVKRINMLEQALIGMGFSTDQVVRFVPKNQEEVKTLLYARENGFKDNIPMDNDQRLLQAKEYIKLTSVEVEEVNRRCA